MLGFNGGLLGVQRTATTSAAVGVWCSNEHSISVRAGNWPGLAVNPIPALSPILWYDFADEATVTTSGTEVTQVNSKGTRAWSITKSATGPQYATGINGRKCLDWGSANHSNYLRNTDTTSTSVAEIYAVIDASFGSTFPDYNGLVSATSGAGWSVGGTATTTGLYTASGFDQAFTNNSASNVVTAVLPTINTASLLRVRNSSGSALTTTSGIQVGNDRNNQPRGWYGLVGEIVMFSAVLGTTDRGSVQSWLATKWNLTLS